MKIRVDDLVGCRSLATLSLAVQFSPSILPLTSSQITKHDSGNIPSFPTRFSCFIWFSPAAAGLLRLRLPFDYPPALHSLRRPPLAPPLRSLRTLIIHFHPSRAFSHFRHFRVAFMRTFPAREGEKCNRLTQC